ncbi:potassium channel family protein [Alkaliphilus transvaalensis]|uniref:potassium channel family protein n=1 Tax=Alkaliphilus transvaalensis TaxID=114628 RepID=UPI00047D5923|nr:potassium channel family protein [Alkaliphilus transvaalensis]
MDKLKRIFPLMIIYILIVCLNIVLFAYLYSLHGSIVDPNASTKGDLQVNSVSKRDILYFSGITYLTIGYGDFKTANGIGQFLAVLQGFSGVLINSIFTGLFLYYLVRRPKNMILTNRIYIRYNDEQRKFFLSIRIGNKGRPLVNVNRIIELFVYEGNIRTRKFQFSQEYHYFENILYWELDLADNQNQDLTNHLRSAILDKKLLFIRISVLGTDADAGELVFTSRTYKNSHLLFIRGYHELFRWKNHQKTKIQWKKFNDIKELEKEKIELFIND